MYLKLVSGMNLSVRDVFSSIINESSPNIYNSTYIVYVAFFNDFVYLAVSQTKIFASLLEFISGDVATPIFVKE